MSLLLGIVLTGAVAIAGTILCPSPNSPSANQNRVRGLALSLVMAACFAIAGRPATAAEFLAGRATVIDGSTLAINGASVKLFGIVTPASDATCWDAHEAPYACGRQVSTELTTHIGAQALICDRRERGDDRVAKATCRVGDEDLGDWMITRGYAVPAGDAPVSYRQASDRAWGRRAGLWGGVFEYPTDWAQAAR